MFRNSRLKPSRKYLGESDDPHYVPDSPIISRQFFTDEEEEELKLSCTLALAEVPHSDDLTEDPLACLAAHIVVGQKPGPVEAPVDKTTDACVDAKARTETSASAPAHDIKTLDAAAQQLAVCSNVAANESATPSEPSRRGTDVDTTISTPLTSPGFTPVDGHNKFADAVSKSQSHNSQGKDDTRWLPQLDTVMSDHKSYLPITARFYATADVDLRREITAGSEYASSPQLPNVPDVIDITQDSAARNSQVNLNKELPSPPSVDASTSSPQKADHLSRLVKMTFKRKAKSAAPTPRDSSDMSRLPARVRISYDPYLASIQEEPFNPAKRRFNFKAFFAKAREPIHQPQAVTAM